MISGNAPANTDAQDRSYSVAVTARDNTGSVSNGFVVVVAGVGTRPINNDDPWESHSGDADDPYVLVRLSDLLKLFYRLNDAV